MTNHRTRTATGAALVTFCTTGLLALPAVTAMAAADTPTDWPDSPHVSLLQFLVVLVLIPVAISLVISLLVALPGFIGSSRDDDVEWRGKAEWFGGPSEGVGATDALESDQVPGSGTGGASGRW